MTRATLSRLVYFGGIYNLSLAIGMFTPPITELLRLPIADAALAQVIGILLAYTTVIQIVASRDLDKFGTLIYWEGILRLAAAALLFRHGFFGHLGLTAGLLGVVDLIIGFLYMTILPQVTGKTPREYLSLR